jgi:hypothetical protein
MLNYLCDGYKELIKLDPDSKEYVQKFVNIMKPTEDMEFINNRLECHDKIIHTILIEVTPTINKIRKEKQKKEQNILDSIEEYKMKSLLNLN